MVRRTHRIGQSMCGVNVYSMHVCMYVHAVHSVCVNTCTYDKYVRKYVRTYFVQTTYILVLLARCWLKVMVSILTSG